LGFFDDVFIPHQSLQHPKRFDQEEQLWVWQYESEGQTHDMFMDLEEEMRFRVVQETFVDTIPKDVQPHSGEEGRGEGVGGAPGSSTGAALTATTDTGPQQAPYTITGSMSESGLGLLSWWTG
jgi:DNA-directed RNA polymerase III subunit RPC8